MRLWKYIMCRWRDAHTSQYTVDYKFEKLSLTEDVDISVYEDAIDFAFANPDVKNIAISGAYGSGKSSVLASYKKKHPKKKFLHISLAHFKASKPQEVSTGDYCFSLLSFWKCSYRKVIASGAVLFMAGGSAV